MEGSKDILAASFAILIVALYLIAAMYIVNPFMRKNFIILDDTVALYIDTMASVESGSVKIPVEAGSIKKMEISYNEKDGDRGMEEDGWYVVVTYTLIADKTATSSSRIFTYPEDSGLASTLFSPSDICIVKERGVEHSKVMRC